MQFRIADTFTDSLTKLTGEEQKVVKTTAFDLQLNPSSPGLRLHRLDRAKDHNFWSIRVSGDVRLIVHKTESSLLLCYVDHHDAAYRWAERRKIERHPTTGAAQLVEIRETVQEITLKRIVEQATTPAPKPWLFTSVPDESLLSFGVPAEWIGDVRRATEDTLFDVAEHLPTEAAEALLDLATGTTPRTPTLAPADADPFAHPDAQRRFRVMTNVEEFERALAFPWEKWTVFLHPEQRHLVERDYGGPARVAGSAGTGKTVVALHRAVHLARNNPDARVLLATFSESLANALRMRMNRLIGNEPRIAERLEVHSMRSIGMRLFASTVQSGRGVEIAADDEIRGVITAAASEVPGHKFSPSFLWAEWSSVVDAWQLATWEEYRDVARLGRKTRLAPRQREVLWAIFDKVRARLMAEGLRTEADMFTTLALHLRTARHTAFEFAVIDEAQDVSVAQLRFLAALGATRPNGLFFAGDLGQRIFQQPFSWMSLGVDVRGRSRILRVNYRTSHQIRQHADRLLDPEIADVDGNVEDRRGTISAFNGPSPVIKVVGSKEDETRAVGAWIAEQLTDGLAAHEIAVFVRSDGQLPRAFGAVQAVGTASGTGVKHVTLDERVETRRDHVTVGTMHLAKGLEFRAVVVMACDDEVIPLQSRIETVAEESDLRDVYDTERQLLYVACTRARDRLLVTAVDPASEFLSDFAAGAIVRERGGTPTR